MQHALNDRRDDRAAYEYTIQPTHDHGDDVAGDPTGDRKQSVWQSGTTPNYKPTPLRWPFMSGVFVLLLVAMVLVIVAEKRMPNSDSSARILGIHPNATQPIRFARAAFTNTSVPLVETTTTDAASLSTPDTETTSSQAQASSLASGQFLALGPSDTIEVTTPTTITAQRTPLALSPPSRLPPVPPSVTISEDTTLSLASRSTDSTEFIFGHVEMASAAASAAVSVPAGQAGSTTSSASLPSGARVVPIATTISSFTTNITIPVTTVTYTSVYSTTEIVSLSSDVTYTTTFVSTVSQTTKNGTFPTTTGTGPPMEPELTTITTGAVSPTVSVSTRTIIGTTTGTSTITGVVIPSLGEFTVVQYTTIFPNRNPPEAQPAAPVVVTGVRVVGGGSVEIVQTPTPVVVVVPGDEVKTQVVAGSVVTGVTSVGGSVVTNRVVITPVLDPAAQVTVVERPDPVTQVMIVDGVPHTVVETPPPRTVVRAAEGPGATVAAGQLFTQTVVNNVGGTPVPRVVVTTPAGPPFQPISYTVVRESGGTLFTEVVVTTPTGAPGQPLTFTAVDVVGGTPVTQIVVATASGGAFQPVSYTVTTMVGGTLTTQTLVTTPTGTEPITLTLVSTSGGTVSTFTSTIPPTTLVTTISGTARTITSTPPPRTRVSTLARSTSTYVSTRMPSSTASADPAGPTVIASTRVYRWTGADIFLGTFLPPLLGVALVIPLRIIDLNAKLYQPFHALTKLGSPGSSSSTANAAPGADTLLLQYTGLLAYVTPAATLLRSSHGGGPPAVVPFLTTLMVLCASLAVPLATEAVGLKLHGQCWANTASRGCGPALGVSPAPAYALVALLALVAGLLALAAALVARWVTGVHANPWSLAGAASLARCEHVRVLQEGEEGMRRAVAEKVYGLGWFGNAAGREEYGIVLLDDAGKGLHRGSGDAAAAAAAAAAAGGGGGSSDDESDDLAPPAAAAAAKWDDGSSRPLPFMALRYPWRIALMVFQLAVLVFVIYYHAYYRGGIRDNGRLWLFLNSNTFGVRFVSAVVGVVIALCWQAFFLSVSIMTPFHVLSQRTQPPAPSILFTPSTNPFSGLYSGVRHRQWFLSAVALAGVLSEFLPVVLSNVPFSLAQTGAVATACAVLACVFLALMLAVLAASFWVRYPPMPVDPRCVAGLMWYVSRSAMLDDFEGVSTLGCKERARRVREMGRRYFYGVLNCAGPRRRLGVDCDGGGAGEEEMGYRGAQEFVAGPEYRS